jgi:hypothetical protein
MMAQERRRSVDNPTLSFFHALALTLIAAFVARRVIVERGLLRDARLAVRAATALLIIGLVVLGFLMMFAVPGVGFICLDYCPEDMPGAITRFLMTYLSHGVVCCAVGWTCALVSLGSERRWSLLTLAFLSLPVALLACALMLATATPQGEILPHTLTTGWWIALNYGCVPLALAWPLATIIALGMTRQRVVHVPSVLRWLAPGR